MSAHAYKKDWKSAFNLGTYSVFVFVGDEVQMMSVLTGVLRSDERRS